MRRALAALGTTMPMCLPGESAACGAPAWGHYATYLAHLKALTQVMLETNLCTPAPGVDRHFAEAVYEGMLDELRVEVLTDMRRQLPDRRDLN